MASDTIFRNIGQEVEDAEGPQVSEIESLCLNCHKDGTTKLLFTKIPFFREVVIMSFECPDCGWQNNELQPAGCIQEKGVNYRVKCVTEKDLSRQVVKTEWSEIIIPEVEFQVTKQSGLVSTIEGIIDRAIEGLKEAAVKLKDSDPESVTKLSKYVIELAELKGMEKPFTFILDDPTGNSYVENYLAPEPDPAMEVTNYTRTIQQDKLIGMLADDYNPDTIKEEDETGDAATTLMKGEVLEFPTNCHNCNAPCFTNMKVTEIPHFKEIIIMATNCDACSHKTREVKSGAGFGEKGVRITTKIKDVAQLNNEVVKSDTCSLEIPELEIELNSAGSGRYTTIEGLTENIKTQLKETNPFVGGDSSQPNARENLDKWLKKLDNIIGYTIILDDPCGNSYVENADEVVQYERTFQQNEELGINDMKVENYSST